MVYWLGLLICILFGVISVIKMVLHSERIILLSMFYKVCLYVYYFYDSIKVLLLCLGYTTTACLVSAALLRFEFGIQDPINKLSLQRTTKILIRMRIHAVWSVHLLCAKLYKIDFRRTRLSWTHCYFDLIGLIMPYVWTISACTFSTDFLKQLDGPS